MKYTTKLEGRPGTTVRVAATDAVQYIDDGNISLNDHTPAIGAVITCETQNIRYAFGADPTQGAAGLGHILYVGQAIEITNGRMLQILRFINATNGSNGFLQITPLYEIGAS